MTRRLESIRRALRSASTGILVVAALTTAAQSQETERVSVDSSGAQGNRASTISSTSSDGLLVAFDSSATNLDAGDTNGSIDCFVHDRASATTLRVSVSSSGGQGSGESAVPVISADGTTVVFVSLASNLASNDGGFADVFVHVLASGVTEVVSLSSSGAGGNGHSGYEYNPQGFELFFPPSVSSDGRFVAFRSLATNLVTGDSNAAADVFVRDRTTGITERVSVDSSGAQGSNVSDLPSISGDGNLVAFQSAASNLVSGDTNGEWDVFVHDRTTGVTERVSVDSSGAEGNDGSFSPSISADGRYVAFVSEASNLVAVDTNGFSDVFVHDRSSGVTERVSLAVSGGETNQSSYGPSISSNGNLVAFYSYASDLVDGDENMRSDVFVHDRSIGSTERVSVDSTGAEANGTSGYPAISISADGHTASFASDASNVVAGDSNHVSDVFVHDRCISPASWSNYGSGFPGTLGAPALTSRANPVLGTKLTLDVSNSYGPWTVGLLFVGLQRTNLHSNWGGDLLVVPSVTMVIALSTAGNSFDGDVPPHDANCGVVIDLQAIEADPGAAGGVSFTPGLELVLGR